MSSGSSSARRRRCRYAASRSFGLLVDPRERVEHARREVAEAAALVERPVGVRLVGEEVAAVEVERALEQRAAAPRVGLERREAGPDEVLELVGVDEDVVAGERVGALAGDDERRLGAVGARGLEAAPEPVHRVADVALRGQAAVGPQRVGDLVEQHRPRALRHEVLEHLAGALRQPPPAQGGLVGQDLRAPERADPQPRPGEPVRVGAAAAVAAVAGAQLHDEPTARRPERGDGQPQGAGDIRAAGQVDADLGHRRTARRLELRQAEHVPTRHHRPNGSRRGRSSRTPGCKRSPRSAVGGGVPRTRAAVGVQFEDSEREMLDQRLCRGGIRACGSLRTCAGVVDGGGQGETGVCAAFSPLNAKPARWMRCHA